MWTLVAVERWLLAVLHPRERAEQQRRDNVHLKAGGHLDRASIRTGEKL